MSADLSVFFALNSLAGRAAVLDAVGVFLASGLIWVHIAAVIVYWAVRRAGRGLAMVCAFVSATVAWLVNQGIGELWFRPRPFVDLDGVRLLINKSSLEKSFPSDHAALAFAFAVSIFLWNRRWGTVLLALATLIALGRVFVGVHYPSDILAGAFCGALAAFVVHSAVHKFLRLRYRPRV